MANILFKKGSYEDFKTKVLDANKVEDGALYLTDNEGGLYLGKSDGTVQRIQGSVLYYNSLTEFTNKVAPPYSSDVIYFIADSNAFVRWSGTEWVVINKTADEVTTQLTQLGDRITAETARAEAAENNLLGKINKNSEDIEANANAIADKAKQSDLETEIAAREALAETVATNTESIGNNATQIDALNTKIDETNEGVREAKEAADAANANANTRVLQTEYDTHVEEFSTFKSTINGNIGEINEQIANNITRLDEVDTALEELEEKNSAQDTTIAGKLNIDGSNSMINDLNVGNHKIINVANGTANTDAANIGQVDSKVKVVNDALESTKTNVANVTTRVGNIETGLSNTGINITNNTITLQNNLNANGKTITGLATLAENPNPADDTAATVEYVKKSIQANDAMTFKGTVGLGATVTDLPDTGVQCGDTYKVATQGTYAGIAAKVGDLFINKAEDGKTPSWEHISSGYEDDYLQKFVVSPDEANNQITIHLTDGVNDNDTNSPSNFVIKGAATSNLKFTASGSTITATMTWGEF